MLDVVLLVLNLLLVLAGELRRDLVTAIGDGRSVLGLSACSFGFFCGGADLQYGRSNLHVRESVFRSELALLNG